MTSKLSRIVQAMPLLLAAAIPAAASRLPALPIQNAATVRKPEIRQRVKADRSFWSFQPVKRPSLPTVKNAAWVKSPIDRFVLARLESKGLKPAPPADRRTLIRRAYFDLIGLPPSPEEVAAF